MNEFLQAKLDKFVEVWMVVVDSFWILAALVAGISLGLDVASHDYTASVVAYFALIALIVSGFGVLLAVLYQSYIGYLNEKLVREFEKKQSEFLEVEDEGNAGKEV